MKLVVPDLISNSYFPVMAAADLGFFEREGLDLQVDLLFPVSAAYEALRAGTVDFVGGGARGTGGFPRLQRREIARCPGAGHVLVPGDAGGYRRAARADRLCKRQDHRGRALG